MKKTKVMVCKATDGQTKDSGKWPCGVCRKGVGINAIKCGKCKFMGGVAKSKEK